MRGPIEIKCTIAAVLLSLYVCPAENRGKLAAEVLDVSSSLENGFLQDYMGLSYFGRGFKIKNPNHRRVKCDLMATKLLERELSAGRFSAVGMGGV